MDYPEISPKILKRAHSLAMLKYVNAGLLFLCDK
jgi:hypothetical protein